MLTKLRETVAQRQAAYDDLRIEDDSGIEILQAVVLAAGLGAAAVAIVATTTGVINGWLAKLPI